VYIQILCILISLCDNNINECVGLLYNSESVTFHLSLKKNLREEEMLVASFVFVIAFICINKVLSLYSAIFLSLIATLIVHLLIKNWRETKIAGTVPSSESTVLITGGTSGIGLELAKLFVRDGFVNVILVSNDPQEKLDMSIKELFQVKSKHYAKVIRKIGNETKTIESANTNTSELNQKIQIITKDLSQRGAPNEVFEEVKKQNLICTHLVNCAGFGMFGQFTELSLEKQLALLHVNIVALTHMSHLFCADMVKNNIKGKVLNVSSAAGFAPGPGWTLYSASKTFVLNFSLSLSAELKQHGITVTTLCPGATQTAFLQSASYHNTLGSYFAPISTADYVAERGYYGMLCGDVAVVPQFMGNVFWWLGPITPLSIGLPLFYYMFKKN
jgi:short-subunit dehydrogenase